MMRIKKPIQMPFGELAWKIEDALIILTEYNENKRIILGGDILNSDLEYTYDNWYFVNNPLFSIEEAVEKSCHKAIRYLNDYILYNGTEYYVIIVSDETADSSLS